MCYIKVLLVSSLLVLTSIAFAGNKANRTYLDDGAVSVETPVVAALSIRKGNNGGMFHWIEFNPGAGYWMMDRAYGIDVLEPHKGVVRSKQDILTMLKAYPSFLVQSLRKSKITYQHCNMSLSTKTIHCKVKGIRSYQPFVALGTSKVIKNVLINAFVILATKQESASDKKAYQRFVASIQVHR